jgi:hypothetical protein
LREILLSQTAFVNAATAPLYGLTASGDALSQVTLGAERPGFLTRVGFLAYNANLREPDPIHRGVDISNRLLCAGLAPPAGEIPPLPAASPGQTNRERVSEHTGSGTCAGCHVGIINPLGFAFENFDAIGRLRDTDNGQAVNTADVYGLATGSVSFSGAPELLAKLAESSEAHACYARRLGEFALARDLDDADRALLNELVGASRAGSIKTMLLTTIQNSKFSTRTGGAP